MIMRIAHRPGIMTSGANLLLAGLAALTSVVIARLFGPTVRGEYATITALLNMLIAAAALGIPPYLARLVAGNDPEQLRLIHLPKVLALATVGGGFLGGCIYIAIKWLEGDFLPTGAGLDVAAILYIPTGILSVLILNISLGQGNWLSYNLSRVLFGVSSLVCISGLFLLGGRSTQGIVICLLVTNIFVVIMQLLLAKKLPDSLGSLRGTAINVLSRSKSYALNSFANISTGYVDVIALSLLFPPAVVAYWAIARTISALISPINNALAISIFSNAARDYSSKGISIKNYVVFFFGSNALAFTLLSIFAPWIVTIVFGNDYGAAVPLVPLALIASIAGGGADLFEERLRGSGRAGPVSVSRSLPLISLTLLAILGERAMPVALFAAIFALSQVARMMTAILLTAPTKKPSIFGQ